jgi:hypothetical protein
LHSADILPEPWLRKESDNNDGRHIFVHTNVRELVNLKEVHGKAKPYQVKQLLALVERYSLSIGGEE